MLLFVFVSVFVFVLVFVFVFVWEIIEAKASRYLKGWPSNTTLWLLSVKERRKGRYYLNPELV